MRKTALILMLLLIGCKNHNTIELTFSRSNHNDSTAIRYSELKLSNEDTIIFNKNIVQDIQVEEKFKFDSLPNGKYILEYSDITLKKFKQKIELKDNVVYKKKIVFDSLPLDKYYKIIPFNKLKNDESYKIVHWGGCVRMESYYQILKLNNQFFLNSYVDKMRKLKDDEINAIKKFETELYALRNKGGCNSTGQTRYCIIKNNIKDTIIDHTCNWSGYKLLVNKLYNSN